MRKLCFVALLWLAALATANAQRSFTVNISDDGEAQLTAFLPEGAREARAVVVLPGGGYSHLSMQSEGTDWAPYYNSQGIACFVLKYRMPKGDRNRPISDAERAIVMVRDSAEAWGVNPYDVGVMGSSAGGHLAATIATHAAAAARPNFQILFYPVITMNERQTHRGSVQNFLGDNRDERTVKLYSNENQVRRHLTPPAIILLANDDRAVPPVSNAIAYYSAMRRQGNDCSLHIYPSGGHGFGFKKEFAHHEQMKADLSEWLRTLPSHNAHQVRVACIGNSITDGHGIDMSDSRGYPAQLQRLLGDAYWVKNFGVSARSVNWQSRQPYMREMAWRDALAFKPNIVVIKLGTNDANPQNWTRDGHVVVEQFERDYQEMIDSLRRLPTPPRVWLALPIKAYKNHFGIEDSLITTDIIPAIKRLAKRNNVLTIDLYAPFAEDTEQKLYVGDGVHPNEKGCARIAEAVSESLLRAVPKKKKR